MKLTIIGRKFTVTEDLNKRITDKLLKFQKYFDEETVGNVVLRSRKNMELIEITIFCKGTVYRAEEEDLSILNAIDRAVDVIERQIRKNKTKLEKRLKIGAFDKAVMADSQWKDVEEEDIIIDRTKKFLLKPMSYEEAVLQMNLVGHDFFMFLDDQSGNVCVVYKRKEDHYGIIEGVSE